MSTDTAGTRAQVQPLNIGTSTNLQPQQSMEQLELYEVCPGCTSSAKHVAAAILITISFVLFVIAVSTNYWVVTSTAHVGLYEVCNKGESCRSIDSNCRYTTSLTSNFMVFHASCDMYNVSRAFTTIACVCAGIAFLCTLAFHSVNWYAGATKTKLSKWGAILYGFAAGITGLIGMSLYARYIVLNDNVTGFGKSAEVGYSFGLSVLAWITALVSAVLDVLALQYLYWEREQRQETILVVIKPNGAQSHDFVDKAVKMLQKKGFHVEHRRRRHLDDAKAANFFSHLQNSAGHSAQSFVGEVVAIIAHREKASQLIPEVAKQIQEAAPDTPNCVYYSPSWREAVTDIQLLYDDHEVDVVGPLAHTHEPPGTRPSLFVANTGTQQRQQSGPSLGPQLDSISSSSLNTVEIRN